MIAMDVVGAVKSTSSTTAVSATTMHGSEGLQFFGSGVEGSRVSGSCTESMMLCRQCCW